MSGRILVLGTGGTIAGVADSSALNTGYRAAALSVEQLVAAVPALADFELETRQVAQVDSKDMSFAIWSRLHAAVVDGLRDGQLDGIVITHGTDTLEETAYFLARTLLAAKPVVLTAAMRPATALSADGPQNLLDAARLATDPAAAGVRVCIHGQVFPGHAVRKRHPYAVNAFASSREETATLEEGWFTTPAPLPEPLVFEPDLPWGWVDIVYSGAGQDGRSVDVLVTAGVQGLVVAATGNGTLSDLLADALRRAQQAGVEVMVVTRCPEGHIVGQAEHGLPCLGVTVPQARVELLLLIRWKQGIQRARAAAQASKIAH
jgi:L-asparaginase